MAKTLFPPKMAMMKISASFPSWDGHPCLHSLTLPGSDYYLFLASFGEPSLMKD